MAIITNTEVGGKTAEDPHKPVVQRFDRSKKRWESPHELKSKLDAGTANVVDLDWSYNYYNGHILGVWSAIRLRLD